MHNLFLKLPRIPLILTVILLITIHANINHVYGKGKLYWIETDLDTSQSKIKRANLNGSHVENVVTDLQAAWDITLDLSNRQMYWITNFASIIQRANLDGSNIENIITGFNLPPGGGRMTIRKSHLPAWKTRFLSF